MVFVSLFSIAVWSVAYVYRRRWQTWTIILLSDTIGLFIAYADVKFFFEPESDAAFAAYIIAIAYLLMTSAVAIFIAFLKAPDAARPCPVCSYDLDGVQAQRCPECGCLYGRTNPKRTRPREVVPVSAAPGRSLASQLAASSAGRTSAARSRVSAIVSPMTIAPPTSATTPTTSQ